MCSLCFYYAAWYYTTPIPHRAFIDYLHHASPGHMYATSMSVPAMEQVISALKLIQGHDGTQRGPRKMEQLRDNSNYFRRRLKEMNLMVLGDEDSPVMVSIWCVAIGCTRYIHTYLLHAQPIMLFFPGKIPSFSRLALDRGIAVTVVGFPATPLMSTRARICISAAHTREDLDWALKVCWGGGGGVCMWDVYRGRLCTCVCALQTAGAQGGCQPVQPGLPTSTKRGDGQGAAGVTARLGSSFK